VAGKISGNIDLGGLAGWATNSVIRNNWISADVVYRGIIPYDGKWNAKGPNYAFRSSYQGVLTGGGAAGGGLGWADSSFLEKNLIFVALSADLTTEEKYIKKTISSAVGNFIGQIFNSSDFNGNIIVGSTDMEFIGGRLLTIGDNNNFDQDLFFGKTFSMQNNVALTWPLPSLKNGENVSLTSGRYNEVSCDLKEIGFEVIPSHFFGAILEIDGNFLKILGTIHASEAEYPVALVRDGETIFVRLRVEAGEN
jgi:hypothetical protein